MSPTDKRTKVLIFAKAPRPGLAKTRLAPLLGERGAAALQARLIEHTLVTALEARIGEVELHGDPADDDSLRSCAARHGARLIGQGAGDIGARMCTAVEQALPTCARVLLVGSDCPALTAEHLRLAAYGLEAGDDAVFVPTEDGGYALIGLARCDARLFAGIAWSTSRVMEETRARLLELTWRWRELETLWDIDTPSDYERLVASGLLKGIA